jgi:hypothetical protein
MRIRDAAPCLLTVVCALPLAACGGPHQPGSSPGDPCIEPGGFALVFAYNDYCVNGLECDHTNGQSVCVVPAKPIPPVARGAPCTRSGACLSGHCVKGGADKICCAEDCLTVGLIVGSCATSDRCSDDGRACLPAVRGTKCLGLSLGFEVACLDDHTMLPNVCDGQGACGSSSVAVACTADSFCLAGPGCMPGCTNDGSCDVADSYRCDVDSGRCLRTDAGVDLLDTASERPVSGD